ncbi:hypothetical protein Syun_016934 [Stephania yunnanensis]|uniref:WAT1-related protein n=1 Tax=Stephania yunnanensis TaxID=152371 RepID=A0AAP0P1X4_9MAGN
MRDENGVFKCRLTKFVFERLASHETEAIALREALVRVEQLEKQNMGSMEKLCKILHGLKPTLLMVVVQTVFAGVNVLYKLAIDDGMNLRILVAYRYVFAAATISPLAFFLERLPPFVVVLTCAHTCDPTTEITSARSNDRNNI